MRASAAEERNLWTAVLEAEERGRLESLRARMKTLEAKESLTRYQVNALLVSAIQGQVTLLRMSRVFPERAATRLLSLSSAVRHSPTVSLAGQLYRCWRALGVTDPTLEALLRHAVSDAGNRTWKHREDLFSNLTPKLRRGVDPKAHAALEAEGSGQ